ncbi:MAG TPA: CoA ester lyase [Caulobacteraceae bacterium]|jgi:citrate lyase subunit beta/citryl-CoA lyase|nr:CoA ester lyase [Caulobacteraceae bacterium]
MIRPLRSVLFLPASNARALEKARSLDCDAVVLDLEDAVAPEQKRDARAAMVEALHAGGFMARTLAVRVNGLDTEWGEEDLIAAAGVAPDAILAPKIGDADAVEALHLRIAQAPQRTRLWAMIETCQGVMNLREIAAAGGRLSTLVVGVNDLSKDMRRPASKDRAPLMTALHLSVTAARANGLNVLDGVYNDLDDLQGLERECVEGRALGFDGKCLLHPNQIDAANRVFAPTADEIAWARAVVEAFARPDNADRGVLRVQGRMVERLHLEEAEQTLEAAGAAKRSA